MTDLRDQLQQDLGSAYTLERELGGGGMSRVFLAKDNALGRQVVIKILPPEMAAAVSSQRFRREVQLAANLQHPHIVPLLSAGETNGLPYFTMPYVKGESLKAHLLKTGELPLSEAIRILREVASALAYAHENDVVHRDIKPDNVLISGDSAVVTDFGIAKALTASSEATGSSLTSMGVALGTPAYMAPEQAMAEPHTDHRADIYAFGVMAYEMITGTTPFANRTPQATLAAHVTETPEPVTRRRSNTPPGLAAIVMRCLEKRASDRPQSARELMSLLDALTTPSGGMAPTASYRVVKRPRWMIPAAIALVFVLGLGAVGFSKFNSRGKDPAASFVIQRSIAVLPFKNMSGDPSNEFFSDGLSEELLNVLGQIRGLRVAARGSSFQFKGKEADIREIGQKLGVETVLDGSVRKSGDQVRITAQLIDTKTGYQLWSETFDRKMDDVFAVQNQITRSIGQALNLQFDAARYARLAQGRPVNAEAYELYLKGVFTLSSSTERSTKSALANFQQAIQHDSGYTAAWAQVAQTYLTMAATGFMRPEEANRKADSALKRALALDPELPLVRMAYATHLRSTGDVEKAESVLKALIEQNPNHSGARASYARLLATRGDAEGAVREMQVAMVLNPLSTAILQSLGIYLMLDGKKKEAIERLREYTERRPTAWAFAALAQAFTADGQYAVAIQQAEKATAMEPGDSYIDLTRAYVYAKAGRRADALKIVDAETPKPDVLNYAFEVAGVYSALGENDRAFEWLDKLPTVHGTYFKLDPLISGLRDDPRYQKVLAKWKLN